MIGLLDRAARVGALIPSLLLTLALDFGGANAQTAPPLPSPDASRDTFWDIETSVGSITVRLFTDVAPRHAANIAKLARAGTYDGRYFHRVIPGFVAQGGGMAPTESGRSGPGYTLGQERDATVGHDRAGLVSMAAAATVDGEPHSHGSEFFIILAAAPWLDDRNTVIGEVVAGMDAVAAVEAVGTKAGAPTAPVTIVRTSVRDEPTTLARIAAYTAPLAERIAPGADGWVSRIPEPPALELVPGKDYHWHLDTSHGPIRIELAADAAPRHVTSILYLTTLRYFDGLYFNRVIPGFMAQGGGTAPTGRGAAGPPYALPHEQSETLRHDRPARVSMVSSGGASVSGQFFITLAATPWLDERHTVVGRVVDGFETLTAIEAVGSTGGVTSAPVMIERARVTEATRRKPRDDAAILQLREFVTAQRALGLIDSEQSGWRRLLPQPPDLAFTPGRSYLWHLETNVGAMTIRFRPDVAPRHVTNFVYLSEIGYFDGLGFHRVIPRFMAQGGRAPGGGPGYTLATVTDPDVTHDRAGILSMANTGQPNSEGSQFFITFRATAWLNGKHTIFGQVIDGLDTVRNLEQRGQRNGTPTERLRIERTWITVE